MNSISDYAFSGCSNLKSLQIPNSVTFIGSGAFQGCRLTSITIPASVNYIGEYVFSGCNELVDVYCKIKNPTSDFENNYTSDNAFADAYPEYMTLHVPSNLIETYRSSAPWSSFGSFVGIEDAKCTLTYKIDGEVYKSYEVSIGASITAEEAPSKTGYTFSGWSVIPETMPAEDVTITGTFSINKYKLTYILDGEVYKEYLKEEGEVLRPVSYPDNFSHAIVPEWEEKPKTMPDHDVTLSGHACLGGSCGDNLLWYFDDETKTLNIKGEGNMMNTNYEWSRKPWFVVDKENVQHVVIGEGVVSIGNYAFYQCSDIISVDFPESLKSIGNHALEGCEKLQDIALPASVETFGNDAFSNNSLTTLTIPSKVAEIRNNAFTSTTLENIHVLAIVPPVLDETAFSDYSVPLYVPEESYSAYKNHEVWGRFTHINDYNTYHELTLSSNGRGHVQFKEETISSGSRTFDVAEGNETVITFTPDAFNSILALTVNGEDRTADIVNGTLTLATITENTTISVTFGTTGDALSVTLTEPMATLCATEDLNFTSVSGLEAYIGSGFNRTTGVLLMTRVYDVPAGTGLVLKGNPGTYEIPYSPSPSVYVNLLEGVTSAATIGQTEGGYTNYILANGTNGTGFYLVSGTGQLAAGKAYLRIPSASAARIATIALDFDEGTTGIYSVESQNEEEYYSVSGQRIEGTPQKSGIYVKNGRKVIIK